MKLFDLHSDTLYEAAKRGISPIDDPSLMLKISTTPFSQHRQILAVWSDKALDDDSAYAAFFQIMAHYRRAVKDTPPPTAFVPLFAVEDARLLGGDLGRLEALYREGVRLLTLTWQGNTAIGGAWDTDTGLLPFGKEVVKQAQAHGITVDLSHASDRLFYDVLSLADAYGFSPVASHSNSRALCPHQRNLSDEMFRSLIARGGLVGISFVPHHLRQNGRADLTDVLRHIEHFLLLGGEDHIALGSDFDGVDTLPVGLSGSEALPTLYRRLEQSLGTSLTDKIFFENAHTFFEKIQQ